MINEREEAYKIIVKVLKKNLFSDALLKNVYNKFHKNNISTNLFYTLVKGTIKMQKNLDYIACQFTEKEKFHKTDLKIKVLIYLGLYQMVYCDSIPDHAAINETVELAKKLFSDKVSKFVNAILRAYQRSPEIKYSEDDILRISQEYSFPEDLLKIWVEEWGIDNTEMLCMYFNDIPRLNIRVNQLATTKEKLKNYFVKRDIGVEETDASPMILITNQAQEALGNVAMIEGYYSIQDPAAALVVELMSPKKNEHILDLFAGPGGKVTFIAEKMNNTGEIIAVDKFPQKIKKLKKAIENLEIKNILTIVKDSFNYGPIIAGFDRVLLDVPCSGWGVFQKKSELRWQKNQKMDEIKKLQFNALMTGAKFVRPEGFLIYSTCTLNREENEKQIERFLKRKPNFKLINASNFIPKKYVNNGYLKTIPHIHHMDGAFAAKLKRVD